MVKHKGPARHSLFVWAARRDLKECKDPKFGRK